MGNTELLVELLRLEYKKNSERAEGRIGELLKLYSKASELQIQMETIMDKTHDSLTSFDNIEYPDKYYDLFHQRNQYLQEIGEVLEPVLSKKGSR